jgi:DNA-binding transcriptional MerR regulator
MQTSFTIGDLAKEFGVTLRTLRFYEDKDLIHPKRQGLSRLYSRRDRARVRLVLLGKKIGLSLKEIKEMLEFYDLRDGNPEQLRAALGRFTGQVAMLRRKKNDVEQAISELTHTIAIIEDMLRARGAGHSEAILEAAE